MGLSRQIAEGALSLVRVPPRSGTASRSSRGLFCQPPMVSHLDTDQKAHQGLSSRAPGEEGLGSRGLEFAFSVFYPGAPSGMY